MTEGEREAQILGEHDILMMRNHGPLVVGPTVAAAFDRVYYLEQTCERQLLAMAAIMRVLDREEPGYAD